MGEFNTVLVSRPEPQASALAELLADAGIPTIVSPAFRFEPVPGSVTLSGEAQAASTRLMVFTSPRAVQYGLQALSRTWIDDALVAAIGPATARALAKAGHEPLAVAGGHHTSEDLLAHPQIRRSAGTAVVVTAPGGRGVLAPGLEALGWRCETLEVYRRIPCSPDDGTAREIAAAGKVLSTWTSGQAMQVVFRGLSGKPLENLRAGHGVVASPRLADLARDHGLHEVTIADGADNSALVDAVRALWQRPDGAAAKAST